jgi:lipopolysaccharide/colanic/teichoic acid biosynthesis glycosyltransferase
MNTYCHIHEGQRREHAAATRGAEIPVWKRILDIGLIVAALPLLLPLMLCVAVIIRLVSRGPIVFKQERIGQGGRGFMCLKFRTMVVGDDTPAHEGHLRDLMGSDRPLVKMDRIGDPRIIPFGVMLRASGLDELPQIVNILKGEMSIVGPRPCLRYEYDRYLPWQKQRFGAVAGLTGLWQVSGKNRTTFDQMIRLDLDYCRRQSAWLDFKIMLLTFPALWTELREAHRDGKALRRACRRAPAPALYAAGTRAAGRRPAVVTSLRRALASHRSHLNLRG